MNIANCPAERQTLLFSATYPDSIAALSASVQTEPVRVSVEAQVSSELLQQAAYEEYRACRAPHNWVHAVSAVKQVAVAAPTGPHRVWPEIAQRLAA